MRTSTSFAPLVFFIIVVIGAGVGYAIHRATGNQLLGESVGGVGLVIGVLASLSIKVADQWEKVVVLRLGKFHSLKGPGLFFIIPVLDQIPYWIDTRVITTRFKAETTLTREREQGTFDQLLVSPFHPFEIMAGKALPCMLIGAVMATSILLVAWLWFRIPIAASLITLYAGLILFLLAAVGIGLFVSSIAATMQQALLYSFLVMIPFMLLSGLATPVSSMPQSVQYFTLINPLRYAIEIAQRVYLEGAGIGRLWPDLWPMAIIAAITLTAAAGMFRKRLA